MGALVATLPVQMTTLLTEAWPNDSLIFPSQTIAEAFIGAFMDLRNHLSSSLDDGHGISLTDTGPRTTTAELCNHLKIRQEEASAFISGLDLGHTDHEAMTPAAQKALRFLTEGNALMLKIQNLLEDRTKIPEDDQVLSPEIDQLDKILIDSITVIGNEQKHLRMKAQKTGTSPGRVIPFPTRDPGQRIGRNDSCPCGSGLKYNRCCGK